MFRLPHRPQSTPSVRHTVAATAAVAAAVAVGSVITGSDSPASATAPAAPVPASPGPVVVAQPVVEPIARSAGQPFRASRSITRAPLAPAADPKAIARLQLAQRGWSDQWSCLNSLWAKESDWKTTASNPSGAYGIPQALPGSKMGSAGPNWQSNPTTQITWGLDYIDSNYGTPCAAWSHSQSSNWY